jgi:hypothetical protein
MVGIGGYMLCKTRSRLALSSTGASSVLRLTRLLLLIVLLGGRSTSSCTVDTAIGIRESLLSTGVLGAGGICERE